MRSSLPRFGAALILLLPPGTVATAAILIFKDGFVLQGDVKQGQTPEFEGGTVVPISTGPMFLDDGPRRFLFSHQQLEAVENKGNGQERDIVKFTNPLYPGFGLRILPFMSAGPTTDWDDQWQRDFTLITPANRIKVKQRINLLTPHYARIDAVYQYAWNAYYLTDELGPRTVRDLLAKHRTLKMNGDKDDVAKRFRIYRFLVQAGWYDLAEEELRSIEKDLPAEKTHIAEARTQLAKLRALVHYDAIELAYRAGRHQWVQSQLAAVLTEPLNENQKTDLHVLQDNYRKAAEGLANAQRFLHELAPEVADASERSVLAEAAAAIADEVTIDDFLEDSAQPRQKLSNLRKTQRLSAFVQFALQAEREKKLGKAPSQTPANLLALAVTGWLVGADAAETKASSALRFWRARKFVLDYERTRDVATRKRLLDGYQRGPKLTPDELAQVIAFLPPAEPAPLTNPQELVTDVPHPLRREIPYLVQLPPEYTHSRFYPVLFVLHGHRETPLDALKRWSEAAAQHGYIVVAPQWGRTLEEQYASLPAQQAGVLDVLRDLRRRFQVDSDRVFLSGLREGADMAYDVGLGHPDLFAGLLPTSGDPRGIPQKYWPNAQYLPAYVVTGGTVGDITDRNLKLFKDHWLVKGFPAILVEYKGRGHEWFPGEVTNMLNWMDRKVRAHGVPDLGRSGNGGSLGTEFQTLRQIDNHFYWLSTSEIDDQHLSEPRYDYKTSPAALDGRIAEGNQIIIEQRKLHQLTVWLGVDMRERIDFDKPLTIRVNNALLFQRHRVQPDLTTLLEDLYDRGDRQRLVLAKVSFDRLR